MKRENHKLRMDGIIERLVTEDQPDKYLNELVLFGYKPNFKDFIDIISSQLNKKLEFIYKLISLNPGLSIHDLPSENKKVDMMDSVIKLIQRRLEIPDEQDVKAQKTKGLTEAERNFIRDQVKEIHQVLLENNASQIDKINAFKSQITGRLAHDEDSAYRRFFIKTIKREIKLLEKFSPKPVKHPAKGTKETPNFTGQETSNFKNNFDGINPQEIYEHFKEGLVDNHYLTEQELKEYLKAAFETRKVPETLFKIKEAPKKSTIEAVFYRYYKNIAGKVHGKQNQYAALLGDYFEGYKTTTVSSNFSKSVY